MYVSAMEINQLLHCTGHRCLSYEGQGGVRVSCHSRRWRRGWGGGRRGRGRGWRWWWRRLGHCVEKGPEILFMPYYPNILNSPSWNRKSDWTRSCVYLMFLRCTVLFSLFVKLTLHILSLRFFFSSGSSFSLPYCVNNLGLQISMTIISL